MEKIVNGELYTVIPYEDLRKFIGSEIFLMYRHSGGIVGRGVLRDLSPYQDGVNLNGVTYLLGWVNQLCYHLDSCFIPYVKGPLIINPNAPSYCYCDGPAVNKRCFDTFTVEKVCVRCHRRKQS